MFTRPAADNTFTGVEESLSTPVGSCLLHTALRKGRHIHTHAHAHTHTHTHEHIHAHAHT